MRVALESSRIYIDTKGSVGDFWSKSRNALHCRPQESLAGFTFKPINRVQLSNQVAQRYSSYRVKRNGFCLHPTSCLASFFLDEPTKYYCLLLCDAATSTWQRRFDGSGVRFCAKHRLEGMVNVRNRRCEGENCTKVKFVKILEIWSIQY